MVVLTYYEAFVRKVFRNKILFLEKTKAAQKTLCWISGEGHKFNWVLRVRPNNQKSKETETVKRVDTWLQKCIDFALRRNHARFIWIYRAVHTNLKHKLKAEKGHWKVSL